MRSVTSPLVRFTHCIISPKCSESGSTDSLPDIHDGALSSTGDDSLAQASAGGIKGEVVLIFGVQDGHIVCIFCSSRSVIMLTAACLCSLQSREGRSLIREKLTAPEVQPPLTLSFLELQVS